MAGIDKPSDQRKQADANRILPNIQGRFWCGFCNCPVVVDRWSSFRRLASRLDHLQSHFGNGSRAHDWVALNGNGRTKAAMKALSDVSAIRDQDELPSSSAKEDDNELGTEAFQQYDDMYHPKPYTFRANTLKTEDEESINMDLVLSSVLHTDRDLQSPKLEQEIKRFSVEVSSLAERAWHEPRYSVEPRYAVESRGTDELLRVGHVRMSDEPTSLDQLRRTDELREAALESTLSARMLSTDDLHQQSPVDEQGWREPQPSTHGNLELYASILGRKHWEAEVPNHWEAHTRHPF